MDGNHVDKSSVAENQSAVNASGKGTNGRKIMTIAIVVLLVVGVILCITLGVVLSRGELGDDHLNSHSYTTAAVASDHQTCSTIGKNILQQGGSAADAGIAAMICVGLVNCHSTGIGGGHFSLFYDRTAGTAFSINAREKAPIGATEDMYVGTTDASTFGGLAVGVPGEIQGFYELSQRAGRLPWKDLFTPSIKLAREGFPIGGALYIAMNRYEDIILNDPSLRYQFADADGNLLQEGDEIRFPELADTLEIIANNGSSDAFYHGELAATITSEIQARDGIITTQDLEDFEAEVEDKPSMVKLDDITLYSSTLPSGGPVLSYIMNILDGYDFSRDSVSSSNIGLTYHRIAEAFKFGFARRAELGDNDFEDVKSIVEYMLSEEAAEATRRRITDDVTHEPEYYSDTEFAFKEDSGTTHVSVIDAEGNALSMTSSINLYLGSKVRGNITGIFYNNEMDDFSTPNTTNYFGVPASPTNFIKPGKRPMSSMVPVIAVDGQGDVRLVTGAAGGTTITTSSALLAMHSLWFGDNVREASERRRIHHQLYPPTVRYEEGIQQEVVTGLTDRGHDVETRSSIAVAQLVTREDGNVYAISDSRKPGHGADGY